MPGSIPAFPTAHTTMSPSRTARSTVSREDYEVRAFAVAARRDVDDPYSVLPRWAITQSRPRLICCSVMRPYYRP